MTAIYRAALDWQSRAVVGRHVRVHLRGWHTVLLPPVCEPVVMLLAFGVGLGGQIEGVDWHGRELSYLVYLGPGIVAYTTFMSAFFQSLFAAFIRMHYQKSWEGQLTTQVRLEHVVWGEAMWAATLATGYAATVGVVLAGFGAAGWVSLHWGWLPVALPLVWLAALSFAAVGLFFTAVVPSIDHMSLPFFLVILPVSFVSSTYFPLPEVGGWGGVALGAVAAVNPLHHLAEGLRWLLVGGAVTWHLAAAAGLCTALLAVLVPVDMRLLRRRVFGEG